MTNRVVLHGVLSPLCGILRIVIPKYFYPQPDCPNFKNVVKKFGNKKLMPIFAVPIAEIAQLVEHDLAKVGVASSSLVFRSKGQFTADLFSCPDLPGCSSNSRPRVALRRRAGEDMKVRVSTSQTWVRVSFSALKVSLPLTFFHALTFRAVPRTRDPGSPSVGGPGRI